MGSGDWFKTIIRLKKAKNGSSKRIKGSSALAKSNSSKLKNSTSDNNGSLRMSIEEIAAIRIQTGFRAYVGIDAPMSTSKVLSKFDDVVLFDPTKYRSYCRCSIILHFDEA